MGKVTEIKKANGEVMRIIDGEYVIGANSGCFANPSPCRKIINGEYLVEGECGGLDCSGGCVYDEYYDGGDSLGFNPGQLTFLDKCIGCYTNLKYLALSSNNLTTLPNTIGNLSNLKYLDLYENNLTTLPDTIGNLSNLELLDLGSNNLTVLPDSISNLDNENIRIYLTANNFTNDYKDHIRNDLFPIANANGHLHL